MSKEFNAETETFMGVPRKKIPWYPTIDYPKCNFCMECDKFCMHKVYERRENEEKKLIIKNPNNCVVFCRACLKTCAPDALSFPDKREIIKMIKQIRAESK